MSFSPNSGIRHGLAPCSGTAFPAVQELIITSAAANKYVLSLIIYLVSWFFGLYFLLTYSL